MRTSEAATALGVSQATVRNLIGRGRIRAKKYGGWWSISSADLGLYDITRRPVASKPIAYIDSDVEVFWSRVTKTETCWTFRSSGPWSYGSMIVHPNGPLGEPVPAHRFSWTLHNGPIPPGLWVLHHCDNKPCVRPDHLFLGTALDNAQDALAKGLLWKNSGPRRPR